MKDYKINGYRLSEYQSIVFYQPLAHNKKIKEIYTKTPKGWGLRYESDSVHHICPYDGVFRNCADCGALDEDFDISYCTDKKQYFTDKELFNRIQKCLKAQLGVDYNYEEDVLW